MAAAEKQPAPRGCAMSADPQQMYEEGRRAGAHAAGRRAGRILGLRLKAQQRAAQERAATEDRRRRALLSAELGESRAMTWEQITKRLADLHRERYHFEALARDAGRC